MDGEEKTQQFPGRAFQQRAAVAPGGNESVKTLIQCIRNAGLIKDRSYRLKTYENVLVGEETVKWFIENTGQTSDQIVQQMQVLVDGHALHHVVDEHDFKPVSACLCV